MEPPKELSPAARQMMASKDFAAKILGIENPESFVQQRKDLQKKITKPENVEVSETPDKLEEMVMIAVGPMTKAEISAERQIAEANGDTLKLADLALRLGADGIDVFGTLIKTCRDNLERAMRARYVMELTKDPKLKEYATEQYKKYSPLYRSSS